MIQIITATGDAFESPEITRLLRAQLSNEGLPKVIAGLRQWSLPKGFKFLVRDDMTIVEPALMYLREKCLVRGRIQTVGNTQKAYCEDLYEWWMWLGEVGTNWDQVDSEDIVRYRDALLQSFSPHTHRRYKTKTIRRRLSTILGLYDWAYRGRLMPINIDRREIRNWPNPNTVVSELLPRVTDEELIRPMNNQDLLGVLMLLGARAPALGEIRTDTRPVRDRLVATVQVTTGMRIDEVLSLTIYQILDLRPRTDDPAELVKLRIVKTKGLRPRIVSMPSYVLSALHWYIDHEREEALKKARSVRLTPVNTVGTTALFVNGVEANNRDVGKPLRSSNFMSVFDRGVRGAGLVHQELHRDPETGIDSMKPVTNHSSHDLRHTFAVQHYHSLKRHGDPAPWRKIQVLLGHQHSSTTMDIYLRSVEVDEARITDAMSAVYKQWHNDSA
jgi:site-specific recombinase XerD